jgi:hypothetical protein
MSYVWGADLEDNRNFVFYVSDSQDLAKENFKPRYVEGDELGEEWDEPIKRYWRERDHVQEMKRVNEELVKVGWAPLEWLEKQESEGRGRLDTEDENAEFEEEERVGILKKSPGDRRRKSSGGSRNVRFSDEGRELDTEDEDAEFEEDAEYEEEPVGILKKPPGEPGAGAGAASRRDSGGSKNVRFVEGC